MSNYLKEFKKLKDQGLAGLAKGIPFVVDKLNSVIPGVQKERIHLWGGNSGTGKSKSVNEHYMFTVFEDWYKGGKQYPLMIHYFSLEIPRGHILAALVVRWLYNEHGVLVDIPYILGFIHGKPLDPYYNELLESDELALYIAAFEEVTLIMDTNLNTVGFNIYLQDLADNQGVAEFTTVNKADGTEMKMFESYLENDERQINIIIIDHLGLVKHIQGQTERTMMIEMADIMIKFRNRYRFTFVVTQQLNRNSNSADRHKLEDLLIKDLDFRGSSAMFDAADAVIGIFSPNREKQNTFLGYRIAKTNTSPGFMNRMIVYNGVKNRHGETNWTLPLLFVGEIGRYEQLSEAKDFDYAHLEKFKKHY